MALLGLSACAVYTIKNQRFCGDMGEFGATCFYTLDGKQEDIPKEQWDIERQGQICEKAEVFADWKAAIEKLCSTSGQCTYEDKEKMRLFFYRLDTVVQKTKK